VKGLDSSSQHLRGMCDCGNILNCETGFPNHLSSSSGSKYTDIILDQAFSKIKQAGFVIHRDDCYWISASALEHQLINRCYRTGFASVGHCQWVTFRIYNFEISSWIEQGELYSVVLYLHNKSYSVTQLQKQIADAGSGFFAPTSICRQIPRQWSTSTSMD